MRFLKILTPVCIAHSVGSVPQESISASTAEKKYALKYEMLGKVELNEYKHKSEI